MKITAQFAMWSSIVFGVLCIGVAVNGFSQLDALTDQAARADGRGYAFFWLFLGLIAVGCALVSRWIVTRDEDEDSEN